MKNLTIIIPIHKFNKEIEELLGNAIKSIDYQNTKEKINLLFVFPPNIENDIKKISISEDKILVNYLINNDDTSYQNQINLASKNIKTKYFTVLEFDDELSNTYIKNIKEYTKHYPTVEILLPLIIETNNKNEAIKLTNESVWSKQNVGDNEELGFLTADVLKNVTDFKLSGAIIKTDAFRKINGYKLKIKLTFMYEFLLRSIHNGYKVMSIPKVIYKHLMDRKDSLFEVAMNETTVSERKFWFETAQKEYLFNNDRDIDLSKMYKE
jgi:hypothetical protein